MRSGFLCLFFLTAAGVCCGMCETPLNRALITRNAAQFNQLLSKGALVDAFDRHGDRALHVASRLCLASAVQALLDKGANPRVTNNAGETPLHIAVTGRCVQAVQVLLDRGADPQVKNKKNKTPADLAQEYTDTDRVTGPLEEDFGHVLDEQMIQEILMGAVVHWAQKRGSGQKK